MDKWKIFKFSATLVSVVTYFYGGRSEVMGAVFTLVIIDYVTGLFAAGAEGKKGTGPGLKSKIGLRRHRSKSIYFCNGGRLGAPIPLVAR